MYDKKYQPVSKCCSSVASAAKKKHFDELLYVRKLDRYESLFYENLEVRKRAIKNWK